MQTFTAARLAPFFAALALPLAPQALADSTLVASSRATPVSANAHVMFRIVIPQTLAFSVIDQPGAQGPALNLQLQLNNDEMRLAPASLTRMPLVRCNPGSAGQTVCTAAAP
jgi:hypothetical protein